MSLNRSLRQQTLLLMGGSLLLMLLVALITVSSLAGDVRSYRSLLENPVTAANLINRANLEFKNQVQEWKNVLLRGGDPDDQQKYWKQFEAAEQSVEATLQEIKQLDVSAATLTEIDKLSNAHQLLATKYRTSLDAYIATGMDPTAGDRSARGIDRDVSE